MKKSVIAILFSLIVLISCTSEQTIYVEPPSDKLGDGVIVDAIPMPPQEKVRTKSSEIRITNVQDMKVFNNELYFFTTDKYAGATLPSIYRYVDEKTPPIKVFETDWKKYKDRLKDLYSLEEHNGELYSGGPMGLFKLENNKFKEVEQSYGFDYLKNNKVSLTLIKAVQGKLYGILNYRTIMTSDKNSYETAVTTLAVLEGNTWKLATESLPINEGGLSGVEDLKEHKGEFHAGYSLGGIAKLEKDKSTNKQYWLSIPTEEPYDLSRFTLLESYNEKLYACGESSGKGNIYSLDSFSVEEMKAKWTLELDYKDSCVFIKKINGKLYVGADELYDSTKSIKPLHVFDGKSWKLINFVNAPGLSKGQFVTGATTVEHFNGKLFIAVKTNYDGEFEMQPSFYTLEDNGTLTPITWWKE